jgi:hypothetical protein
VKISIFLFVEKRFYERIIVEIIAHQKEVTIRLPLKKKKLSRTAEPAAHVSTRYNLVSLDRDFFLNGNESHNNLLPCLSLDEQCHRLQIKRSQ